MKKTVGEAEGNQEFIFKFITFEVSVKYSNRVLSRQLDTGVKF